MNNFAELINKTFIDLMKRDKTIICYGLGIDDPKSIFGTTKDLANLFGSERVFDTPTSENCMTGVGVGLALNGFKPIMVHQRMDFFLYAFDQLVNNAAKWNFMFGKKTNMPFTIRLIVGRGWGQGPTHSQSFHNFFANIPNLKVVCPALPEDVYGLYKSSVYDKSTTIIVEHRWCHNLKINKKLSKMKIPLGKAKILKKGNDITVCTFSYSTIEVLNCYNELKKIGINIEHIDLRCIKPLDIKTIRQSVKKTGRLIVFDNLSNPICSIGDTIISKISDLYKILKHKPVNITLPDTPNPTTHALSKNYYNDKSILLNIASKMLGKKYRKITDNKPFDVPGQKFMGPF
jgi:acetoin:2,6-dichlorophenolindophenol oxidoreductase subunit beta